jgi:serine/threonine-protein phosphatase 5
MVPFFSPGPSGFQTDIFAGQFYDVLRLLSLTGEPSEKHLLLMNGDLVDRGSWSIEVILTAFAFKCKLPLSLLIHQHSSRHQIVGLYPKNMFINRGNHEAKEMNRTYGFEGEAKHKHGEQTYKVCSTCVVSSSIHFSVAFTLQLFAYVFTTSLYPIDSSACDFPLTTNLVPLATLVGATCPPVEKQNVILSPDGVKRYFVTHGGLFSKDGVTLDEIRTIKRIGRQPGTEGLMCMLSFTFAMSHDLTHVHCQARFALRILRYHGLNAK